MHCMVFQFLHIRSPAGWWSGIASLWLGPRADWYRMKNELSNQISFGPHCTKQTLMQLSIQLTWKREKVEQERNESTEPSFHNFIPILSIICTTTIDWFLSKKNGFYVCITFQSIDNRNIYSSDASIQYSSNQNDSKWQSIVYYHHHHRHFSANMGIGEMDFFISWAHLSS